jgi:hypothetical protein
LRVVVSGEVGEGGLNSFGGGEVGGNRLLRGSSEVELGMVRREVRRSSKEAMARAVVGYRRRG